MARRPKRRAPGQVILKTDPRQPLANARGCFSVVPHGSGEFAPIAYGGLNSFLRERHHFGKDRNQIIGKYWALDLTEKSGQCR